MDEAVEVVEMATNGTGGQNLIVILLILLVAIVFVMEHLKKLKDLFGLQNKWDRHEIEQNEKIQKLWQEMSAVKTDEDEIKTCLNNLKTNIDSLSYDFKDMRKQQDLISRARIKDRIQASYNYYLERDKDKDKVQWTAIEKESLLDLLDSYESAGGANSFVHTIILPQVKEWEVVG